MRAFAAKVQRLMKDRLETPMLITIKKEIFLNQSLLSTALKVALGILNHHLLKKR
jgi:hypothetical protein